MKSFELLGEMALVLMKAGDFETQMQTALNLLGEYTGVSRVYIFIDNTDDMTISNTFEWCNESVDHHIDYLQNMPDSNFPSWKKILREKGVMYSENIQELPDDLIKILEPQGIKSILSYPLIIDSKMQGFIGFDDCTENRHWDDSEMDLLKTISRFVSTVYDRKLYRDNLEKSEKNFKALFDTIDDILLIGTMQGGILFCNEAGSKKLGYTIEELRRLAILDMHPEDKREEAAVVLGEMMRGERNYCPLELLRKNGQRFPVETRIWFGTWDGQECIFGLSKDLSSEQEALQKFTKLFENNPALMVISSMTDRKITEVNKSFLKKTGYSMAEVIGKTSADLGIFVHPDKLQEAMSTLKRKGTLQDVEIDVKRKDGSVLHSLLSGEIIDTQGEKFYLTVMVDITEQKRLHKILDDQKLRLTNIIEGTRLGTWEWNVKTGALICNERWAQILGYTLQELEPVSIETWRGLLHPEGLKNCDILLKNHIKNKSDFYEFEEKMKHKDGHWVWVHGRGKLIEWDVQGNPLMMFGTHADISEKKEMEEKIIAVSIRDPLTNVYNRRYITNVFEGIRSEYKKLENCFSVAIIDLDFFKAVNDTYGHQAGDFILKEVSRLIGENLSQHDLLARWGGEEFLVIMPMFTRGQAKTKIDGIREKVSNEVFVYNKERITISFSAGISDCTEYTEKDSSSYSIFDTADKRLYEAKATGRNKTIA
ncbi:MAG TPA: PAS domain S-box protein [Treponemataceae bacterium]|nr:PAS domain S-box protein [Treponemataceae bacterium]